MQPQKVTSNFTQNKPITTVPSQPQPQVLRPVQTGIQASTPVLTNGGANFANFNTSVRQQPSMLQPMSTGLPGNSSSLNKVSKRMKKTVS